MNIERLKKAEHEFLMRYPGGFEHPDMIEISKKHKPEKMNQLAQSVFAPEKFAFPEEIVSNMVKVVTQSSMISVFEKPQFRDFVKTLNANERALLAKGLEEIIHGDQAHGFNLLVDILLIGKMAKWPIATICSVYYRPTFEVFVKPTTAKFIVEHYQLANLKYKPRPSYEFYYRFREYINEMKSIVSPSLSPSNPAFTGFLMMMGMPEHRPN